MPSINEKTTAGRSSGRRAARTVTWVVAATVACVVAAVGAGALMLWSAQSAVSADGLRELPAATTTFDGLTETTVTFYDGNWKSGPTASMYRDFIVDDDVSAEQAVREAVPVLEAQGWTMTERSAIENPDWYPLFTGTNSEGMRLALTVNFDGSRVLMQAYD